MNRDLSNATLRCPECTTELGTLAYDEWLSMQGASIAHVCPECRCHVIVCEGEIRGSEVIDGALTTQRKLEWPPEMRTMLFTRAAEVKRSEAALRSFINVVTGEAAPSTLRADHAALAQALRNRLVSTTLSAAVEGAMNGAANRLALAMRVVALMREAPEVPDPPPCFKARDSVAEMTKQILILAKSIVATEAQTKKDFS